MAAAPLGHEKDHHAHWNGSQCPPPLGPSSVPRMHLWLSLHHPQWLDPPKVQLKQSLKLPHAAGVGLGVGASGHSSFTPTQASAGHVPSAGYGPFMSPPMQRRDDAHHPHGDCDTGMFVGMYDVHS